MAFDRRGGLQMWMTLGQRTLRYETYVMPAPEENVSQFNENLLRRNEKLVGAHFSIGLEDAVYLRGELPLKALDESGIVIHASGFTKNLLPGLPRELCSVTSGNDPRPYYKAMVEALDTEIDQRIREEASTGDPPVRAAA